MRKLAPAVLATMLCACGSDGDSKNVAPALIIGGGIHNAGIDGTVNIYIVFKLLVHL